MSGANHKIDLSHSCQLPWGCPKAKKRVVRSLELAAVFYGDVLFSVRLRNWTKGSTGLTGRSQALTCVSVLSLCLGTAWKAAVGMPGSQCQLNLPATSPFPERQGKHILAGREPR